jgi:hypothetical protein
MIKLHGKKFKGEKILIISYLLHRIILASNE